MLWWTLGVPGSPSSRHRIGFDWVCFGGIGKGVIYINVCYTWTCVYYCVWKIGFVLHKKVQALGRNYLGIAEMVFVFYPLAYPFDFPIRLRSGLKALSGQAFFAGLGNSFLF